MSGADAEHRVKEQAVRLLQRMQSRLDAAEARFSAPVAIVGMACRFPLGDTQEAFWAALQEGRDGIGTVPPERWAAGEGAVAHGGFLTQIDRFDAGFFGISPREAAAMDPQQRLVLEVAWEALEHAGIAADRLEGTRSGVYLGCCTADYARLGDPDAADGYAATGSAPGVAAGRVAYTLGLNGPALVVDTACSSSLVALHLAVQALRAEECGLALTGGVNLTLLPQGAATLDRLSMLSPDGRCKAFDAGANGFVRGEGCGVLVLKRLSDAQAAGDRVLAVIRGTAVNQDGRSAGLTAPNGPAQEAVVRAALANAGLSADAVDYIEAHGTGTALGDPIEMHALAAVFGGRERELLVGSVKTNIGHAEAAAGVAGLIKAVLMLRHQAVPPSLHFRRMNPHIVLGDAPISVPATLIRRPIGCVGVSSFGFSGTNAHVVLEQASPGTGGGAESADGRLFISARTPDALRDLAGRYQALISQGVAFADLCYSAAAGRARLPWWICVDRPEALADAEPSDAPPPDLPPQTGNRVDLPLYPFQRQRHWLDETERLPGRLVAQAGEVPLYEAVLLPGAPLLADHVVRGEPLLPAADMLERLRTAAVAAGLGNGLCDVTFDRALAVVSPRTVQVAAGDPLVLFARDGQSWQRHASATATAAGTQDRVDLAALQTLCDETVDPAAFAAWLGEAGLSYGPFYDCIDTLARGPSQALVRLRPAPYVALLDAAFRTAGAIAFGTHGAARLPAGVARYQRSAPWAATEIWAHAALVEQTAGVSVVDVRLFDGNGTSLACIDGLRLAAAGAADAWRHALHVVDWIPAPSPQAACAAVTHALGDTSALESALDAAAAGFARRALASVDETDLAPRHARLWRHLPRLAARPESDDVPPGPEGALLARCGAALPAVLEGRVDPLPLLFADDAAGAIYRDAPVYRAANTVVAALAAGALPPAGPVRVLEVGAGTGGTTQAVLAALDPARTDYWFTDLSPTLVARARGTVPAQHFATYDLERPAADQGIPEGAFDLVLAANVLHATADLGAAIDNLLRTLAPAGRLLLLETAPPDDPPAGWVDLVFGLTEGWWRFTDLDLRPDYPLLPAAKWAALLEARGLEVESQALPGHTVLLVRRRLRQRVHRDTGGSAAERCAGLLRTIQDLRPEERRLILLTDGAMGPAVADPAAATLWGLMRTLRQERPELEVGCIDCAPDRAADALAAERMTAEPEIVFAGAARLVPRLGPASPAPVIPVDPQRWILVTGGLGGLGRFTAEWLVRRGARHLVLTGRTVAHADWIDSLRASGATVRLEVCDLADPVARAAWIARLPPLGGIIHAAGILDDATLAQARPEQFAAVLAPKLDAAVALDAAFPELDFFVLFSSAVGLFGQAGQATHVAASVGLDALAASRRRRRQHAVSLGWGLWQHTGAAADRTALIRRMQRQGLGSIGNETGSAVLDWALGATDAAVAVLPVDWPRFLASFHGTRPPAATRGWHAAPAATPSAPAQATPVASAGLPDIVAVEAARVLGYPLNQPIDRTANLFEIGLDSLMAVELRNRLQAHVADRALSSTLLFEHSSVAALVAHLAGEVAPLAESPVAAPPDAPVAVIGVGCRLPAGGCDPAAFWQALAEGRDGIVARPDRPDASVAEGAARLAGYLPDVAGFDPTFFGIAPREAVFMDPQHRLLLEVAWEALEDALVPADRLAGTSAGVFLGMCNYDYAQFAAAAEGADGYAGIGGAPSIAAGRIAYLLGLTGPAMVVDTACSSSLVTTHLAVQALRRGECSLALAGGVNLTLGTGTTTALERLHMLSPDGHCKAFDARADGFVRGEGCGIVVLKLLSEAEQAGDRVLAVIRGSAVNQDGRSAGLTAPNGAAQQAVIRYALANAGLQPDDVDYVEAHGTGTALGDPIEMHALASVFAGRDRELLVGSVKTNIGHAEAAAGVAGLIKAVLMLRHQAVPASLHFQALNPHIDLGGVPVAVPTALTPRVLTCVGVSSFGFSGTNAHVVLERAAAGAGLQPDSEDPGWLFISARTAEALRTLIGRYQEAIERGVPFADLAYCAAVGRARLAWWVCVDSPDALARAEPSNGAPPEIAVRPGRRVDLPLYPFQRQHYWVQPRRVAAAAVGGAHPLLGRRLRSGLAQVQHEVRLAPDVPAWLADHVVNGRVVVPAAVLVEMLLAAAPAGQDFELTDVAFHRMLVPAEQPVVQTIADPVARTLSILAAADNDNAAFATIATAAWRSAGEVPRQVTDGAAATRPVDLDRLYATFAGAGLAYGPAFRSMRRLMGGDGIAVAELAGSDPAFRLDPRVLDAAWQSLAAALPPDRTAALVPAGLDRLVWRGGTPCSSVLRLVAHDRADVMLLTAGLDVVAWCEGLRLTQAGRIEAELRETTWQPAVLGDDRPAWLDLRDETDPAQACWRVLEAFRAAADTDRLAVLARGATPAGGTVPLAAQAALVGLVATLAQERPELRPLLLDLDATVVPPPVPGEPGPLLAWRDGELLAPQSTAVPVAPAPAAPFRLERGAAATLDAVHWVPASRRPPGAGEVEIEVGAAGINFRDVMNLLGVYPGDGGSPGVECAGVVVAIGAGVTGFAVGDAVVAIAPGSFASHVVADSRLVCRLPIGLDMRVAAAQPVAVLTARLALEQVAHLAPGQRVLIHAAAGGVGLAAVALARRIGARIVTTAGSAAKRAHLAALGIREVYDSRSLGFAAAPAVDVVLNSLTGEAIPAGMRLLKPDGIFLELGKAELWSEAQVGALRADVRYAAIALDQVILQEPERVGTMLREAVGALANGVEPLPVQPYPFAAVTDALRCLQAARHVGKLVLSRTLLRGDACYVITGGTGALGRHLAGWLVARGARHLVLLARRPDAVEVAGATVRTIAVDVADEAALTRTLQGLALPVKGVFHLAAALHDSTAAQMTRAQLDAAMATKLAGAQALDRATASMRLDLFVLFGSLAGVAGSAGQANYAAANAGLDAVVRARQARGAPALLVDWGAWRGEGMARALSGPALAPDAALAALDAALSAGLVRVSISAGTAGPMVARPIVEGLAERLAGAVGSAKLAVLADAVDQIVARILGLGSLTLERERPLTELGLDSLMAVELRNALGAAVDRTLPASLVFDHPTAEALSVFLAGELGLVTVAPALTVVPTLAPVTLDRVAGDEDLDDDEALLLLERKLGDAGY